MLGLISVVLLIAYINKSILIFFEMVAKRTMELNKIEFELNKKKRASNLYIKN